MANVKDFKQAAKYAASMLKKAFKLAANTSFLEDGTAISYDELTEGSQVFIVDAEGNENPLPTGSYPLFDENGNTLDITINVVDGVIAPAEEAPVEQAEEEAPTAEEVPAEKSPAEVAADAVVTNEAVYKAIVDALSEVVAAEFSKQNAKIAALQAQVQKLSKTAAAPAGADATAMQKQAKQDFSGLSKSERLYALANQMK